MYESTKQVRQMCTLYTTAYFIQFPHNEISCNFPLNESFRRRHQIWSRQNDGYTWNEWYCCFDDGQYATAYFSKLLTIFLYLKQFYKSVPVFCSLTPISEVRKHYWIASLWIAVTSRCPYVHLEPFSGYFVASFRDTNQDSNRKQLLIR